jgi:hypothetical protein
MQGKQNSSFGDHHHFSYVLRVKDNILIHFFSKEKFNWIEIIQIINIKRGALISSVYPKFFKLEGEM